MPRVHAGAERSTSAAACETRNPVATALPQRRPPTAPPSDSAAVRFVETDLDRLSNSVLNLVKTGRLDEAENACRRLLDEFPDQVDGIERLVEVHKAKENYSLAADYAQQTAAFMRERKDDFDSELIAHFEKEARNLKEKDAESG